MTQKLASFGAHDLILLDRIHNEKPVEPSDRERLKQLVELGVIERSGRGRGVRYLLSRTFYEMAENSGLHTRRQGLERETNKELICRHVEHQGKAGAVRDEFRQVLPDLTDNQIKGLLKELQAERRVYCTGHAKGARWYAQIRGK